MTQSLLETVDEPIGMGSMGSSEATNGCLTVAVGVFLQSCFTAVVSFQFVSRPVAFSGLGLTFALKQFKEVSYTISLLLFSPAYVLF